MHAILQGLRQRPAMSTALVASILWIVWTSWDVLHPRSAFGASGSFIAGPIPGAYNKIETVATATVPLIILLFVLAFMVERVWPQLARRD
jgi:hypothetical protein